jgi:hypothetical protein
MLSTKVPSLFGPQPAIRNGDDVPKARGFAGYWVWLLLVLLVAPMAFLEVFLAVAPPLLVYALLAVVGVASVLWAHASGNQSNREKLLHIIILLGCLAILHWVPWNTRKVFLSQFNRIQPGMTIEQVDTMLRPCSLDISEQPVNKTLRSYRHSRLPRFDSDVGIVYFSGEVVTKTEFLFD